MFGILKKEKIRYLITAAFLGSLILWLLFLKPVSLPQAMAQGGVPNYIDNIDISSDGQIIAIEATLDYGRPCDGILRIYDRATGELDYIPSNGCRPAISADGRFVAYGSDDGLLLIKIYDRETDDIITLPSYLPPWSIQEARSASISGDGRFVAFIGNGSCQPASAAECDGSFSDGNFYDGVLVYDRDIDNNGIYDEDGTTDYRLVSVDPNGNPISVGDFSHVEISADGRYVAFYDALGLFIHDRWQSTTIDIEANMSDAIPFFMTPSGRYLAFSSSVDCQDYDAVSFCSITVHDRDSDNDGIFDEVNGFTNTHIHVDEPYRTEEYGLLLGNPHISADGRYVAFERVYVWDGGFPPSPRVSIHDLLTGQTVNILPEEIPNPDENPWPLMEWAPAISADGGDVIFVNCEEEADRLPVAEHLIGCLYVYHQSPSGNYNLSGRVTTSSGSAVPGVQISLESGEGTTTISTDGNGQYDFNSLSTGVYIIEPNQSGYEFAPPSRTVVVPGDGLHLNFTRCSLSDPSLCEMPSLSLETSVQGAYFIQGASVPNQIDALIQGDPPVVTFDLNGDETQHTPSEGVASQTYDMEELDSSLQGRSNILTVEAKGDDGSTMAAEQLKLVSVLPPAWLTDPPVVEANSGEPAKYKWEIKIPKTAFEATITLPNGISYVGGKDVGIRKTQGTLEVEAQSNGTVTGKISGGGGFSLAVADFNIAVAGDANGKIQEGQGLTIDSGTVTLDGRGKVKAETAVTDLFPGLRSLESTFVIGNVIEWFNDLAKLQVSLETIIDPAFNFKAVNPADLELEFDDITGNFLTIVKAALIIEVAVDDLLAEGWGGGAMNFKFGIPADPFLKEIALELFYGLRLKAWRFEYKFEEKTTWAGSFTGSQNNTLTASEIIGPETLTLESTWQPIPRDYVVDSNKFAVFQANQSSSRSAYDIGNVSATETIIASNVFPDGHPSIATGPTTMLVWVHDDITKPLMQGEEIRYSIFDGVSWQSPQNITNDLLQDFNPQVAFDTGNKAVAIWERNQNTQSATSELNPTYTNAFEIAYAVWDGHSWNTPALLTDNSVFDHAPKLIRGNDGQLSALWRQNEAGELLGDNTAPDTVMMAQWNGSGWDTPQAITSLAGLLGYSFARHNSDMMSLIYSQDTDGDYSTIADQELFQLTWNGSSWSGPTRLTNDTQPDNKPSLFYTTEGQPQLLWMKGDTLYGLIGDLTDEPRTVLTEASASMLDYKALRNQEDNLIVFWQGYSDEGVDIWYAVYNREQDAFGPPRQLTQDEPLEKLMSPTFTPNGDLMIAYNKTELLTEDVQITPELVIEDVTTFGETDLAFLQTPVDFSISNDVYLPVMFKN